MVLSSGPGAPNTDDRLDVLWEDGERVFGRTSLRLGDGEAQPYMVVMPAAEHSGSGSAARLAHEYALKDHLDGAWALQPLMLVREQGRTMLAVTYSGGEPLEWHVAQPMGIERFLRLAIAMSSALGDMHKRGLVHKDIKPSNIVIDAAAGKAWLTGFGIASRLPRERQSPEPPEVIAGTLAYMAPEQTGRMNRSIDSRSDLYALGVTFYQMLTGTLPFAASDPMEWVHCHIARTPLPPSARLESIPAAISVIVMKLLAKTAEERYQTAFGLEQDLTRCLAEWQEHGRIDPFAPGAHDTVNQLLTPERLYGREHEVATLRAAFDRSSTTGTPELVLVSGYSGVGKSSIVNELHKVLVPSGLFAAGKFEQHKRDIPYATIAQALQGLIRLILSKSDAEVARWRAELLTALGQNGQLMVELVPELKLIIGEQPPVIDLPAVQAQHRFQIVFRSFVGVFARAEHPLALFLDDLQWLDAATLDLIEDLLVRSEGQHLLLIGAYRDNEVGAAHPLARKLDALQTSGARLERITLAPLGREHVERLIADALRCAPARAASLAGLVHEKTAGNPFFVIRFLSALVDEGLLTFDHAALEWAWSLDRIRVKGYTDNVADLMIGKLSRLPATTHAALRQLACLGDSADVPLLAKMLSASEGDIHTALWEAMRQDLVEMLDGTYRFIHDRVREAAYASISDSQRAEAHLRIGQLLLTWTPTERMDETIFAIVNQLNRGAALIESGDVRAQLAALNLKAGRRAQASAAYASALRYLEAGRAMLSDDDWSRRQELMFALELNRAECEFLTGASAQAEARLATLARRACDTVQHAAVTCQQIDVYLTRDQGSRAIEVALDFLRQVGICWSAHPTEPEARREFERVWAELGRRTDVELLGLPVMTDALSRATLDVLTKLMPPAFFSDVNLFSLAVCQVLTLTLAHGNCDASPAAYVRLGVIAGSRFGDYEGAYRVGRIGCDLVERHGLQRFQGSVYVNFACMIVPWMEHMKAGRHLFRRALDATRNTGDLTYAVFCSLQMSVNLLAAGDPLPDVQAEVESAIASAQRAQFLSVVGFLETILAFVRMLRGLTPTFGSFNDSRFDEDEIEAGFARHPDKAAAEFWYWVRKMQARFMAGDYATALAAEAKAARLLEKSVSTLETIDYHFYASLSRAAVCTSMPEELRREHIGVLSATHRQFARWAASCPENFEAHAALMGAEIARLSDRELEAERLYERAIQAAGANGFVQNQALACELASRFHAARGFPIMAEAYLAKAREGYARWGADGKVRQLDWLRPPLQDDAPSPPQAVTIGAPLESLDLTTVMKMSHAISSEIVLEKLLETLIRTAIHQAGAERGVLIVLHGTEPRVQAEATTVGDSVSVRLCDAAASEAVLPLSVLQYVLRLREAVILDDASAQHPFAADPYIRAHRNRSILCLPLPTQAKLSGVLYLENNLAPGVFAPRRTAVLKLLASQAAIALENAQLYRDVGEREARIRRLVDANIIGTFIWKVPQDSIGTGNVLIVDGNDAFLRIVGYDRADLAAGHITRYAISPPEWRERDLSASEEMKKTGTALPYEKEYRRKDGSRVPVLMGFAAFDERRLEGLAFVVDLTELKRAESEAHESARRYREVQAVLAHASRVATMGQLTASIAHEVSQPIAGAITNAQTALRWLNAKTPDVDEAVKALSRIVRDGSRARAVIDRIRALARKAPPRADLLDLNGAVREVIELTEAEASKSGVSVRMALAEDLPLVSGDRVQLQQVILNLIVNAIESMSTNTEGPRDLHIATGHAAPDAIFVAVQDTGPGLADPVLERLFEPFHTTKPGGLGLGLSICRSIIEAHGGRLSAGAAISRGALFQFTVPVGGSDA